MKSLQVWLDSYSQDHQNRKNQLIHKVCVPAIFLAVVGLLHLIPFEFFKVPVGDIIIAVAMIWYAFLGAKAFAVMFIQLAICRTAVILSIISFGVSTTLWALIGIFVVAWVGQFYGHHLEGRRPSFLTDLQYLLIGPIWVWLGKHKT
jgi:uncharacterized membrane protein YGL010W